MGAIIVAVVRNLILSIFHRMLAVIHIILSLFDQYKLNLVIQVIKRFYI